MIRNSTPPSWQPMMYYPEEILPQKPLPHNDKLTHKQGLKIWNGGKRVNNPRTLPLKLTALNLNTPLPVMIKTGDKNP
jgi:hypothetical protein